MTDRLRPVAKGAYVGLCDLDAPGGPLPTHSATATARIAELRGRYDPRGLFAPAPVAALATAAE